MLSRPEAGEPTGARGRLGGFLPRRTQTRPGRVAARRWEVPPERAKTIRKKERSAIAELPAKNADAARKVNASNETEKGEDRCTRRQKPEGRMRQKGVPDDLTPAQTRPIQDTTGRDLLRKGWRAHRSPWLAKSKATWKRLIATPADETGRPVAGGAARALDWQESLASCSNSPWHVASVGSVRPGSNAVLIPKIRYGAYRNCGMAHTVFSACAVS